jgi:hypothetical protein
VGHCRGGSHRQFLILLSARRSTHANRTDDLAIDSDRDAALKRSKVVESNHSSTTLRDDFLERSRRFLEESGGTGLTDSNICAGGECAIHTLQRHQILLLAGIHRAQGDIGRASVMLSAAAARFQRTLPPGHGAFAGLALQRALNARAAGDLSTALRLSNEAVAIAEASSNIRSAYRLPQYLICRSDVALQLGRTDDAHNDAVRAISVLRSAHHSEAASASFGRAYWMLGRTLQAQNKQVEAAAAFRSASEHLRNALGPDHPDTRSALEQALGQQPTATTWASNANSRNAGFASRLR